MLWKRRIFLNCFTSLLILACSCFSQTTALQVNSKVFRWQDEGGDIIPRILPTISLSSDITQSIQVTPSMQLLGYGHQLGNLSLKVSSIGRQSVSLEVFHNLFNEFPSNGFREGGEGFDPEHFSFGNKNLVTYYRLISSYESEHLKMVIGLENDQLVPRQFSKGLIDFQGYFGNFLIGVNSEIFLQTIVHKWVRYTLNEKKFDVNIKESPTYLTSGFRGKSSNFEYDFISSFLLSEDAGPSLGPCSSSNICRDGATDGFSPIYSKLKFQVFLRVPITKMAIK